eukprot:1272966-Prymnesium_polylepis.1
MVCSRTAQPAEQRELPADSTLLRVRMLEPRVRLPAVRLYAGGRQSDSASVRVSGELGHCALRHIRASGSSHLSAK